MVSVCVEIKESKHLLTDRSQCKRRTSLGPRPVMRRRHSIKLLHRLKEIIELSSDIGIQSSVVMYKPLIACSETGPFFQTFGTCPLTAAIDQQRDSIVAVMEGHQQGESLQDSQSGTKMAGLFSLPLLVFDGISTPVHEMTQAQLRCFIPYMIKHSMKRHRPGWGKQNMKPHWWPEDVPWKNIRTDHRPGDVKKEIPWTEALRRIVIACYEYHGRTDLLCNFSRRFLSAPLENTTLEQKPLELAAIPQTTSSSSSKEMRSTTERRIPLTQDVPLLTNTPKTPHEEVSETI